MRDYQPPIPDWLWLLAMAVLAAALKFSLVTAGIVPFNADEAIVGLMARHILQGERPIFFYGQEYMGSLDTWLVAAGFRVLGHSVWVIRLVQGLLYAGTLLTTVKIGRFIFGDRRVGLLAGWLLAIPTVNVTLYTTISLGGYGEALLLGNLILLVGLKIGKQLKSSRPPDWSLWLLLGFLAGLGYWVLSLTLVTTVPVGIYLIAALRGHLARRARQPSRSIWPAALAAVLGGALIGGLPAWTYALNLGGTQLIRQLSGGSLAGIEGLPGFAQVGQHFINFVVFGSAVILGLRPPWDFMWLGPLLVPFIVAFWVAVFARTARVRGEVAGKPEQLILLSIILTLIIAFILSPFGADPSGRYFLPLAIPLALFAAELINTLRVRHGNLALMIVPLILFYNLWGTLEGIQRFPAGITVRFDVLNTIKGKPIHDLILFLRQQGETRGYTNYWVAYPLAFLSGEELIFVPRLPYHADFSYTSRDDRYAPYGELVSSAPQVAYITTNFPELDATLREGFTALNIEWEETEIGEFRVFYRLSGRVDPTDLGLGFDNP